MSLEHVLNKPNQISARLTACSAQHPDKPLPLGGGRVQPRFAEMFLPLKLFELFEKAGLRVTRFFTLPVALTNSLTDACPCNRLGILVGLTSRELVSFATFLSCALLLFAAATARRAC